MNLSLLPLRSDYSGFVEMLWRKTQNRPLLLSACAVGSRSWYSLSCWLGLSEPLLNACPHYSGEQIARIALQREVAVRQCFLKLSGALPEECALPVEERIVVVQRDCAVDVLHVQVEMSKSAVYESSQVKSESIVGR